LKKRPLVPVELEPLERFDDRRDRLGRRALAVGVLDAQDKAAPVVSREEEIEQGGAGAADVQITGRTWGEAGADLGHPIKLTWKGAPDKQHRIRKDVAFMLR
jgi:hypothetical protein